MGGFDHLNDCDVKRGARNFRVAARRARRSAKRMSSQSNIPVRAWIDLLLLALVWGAIFLFVAIALREMTPFWVVFHRVFWATLLLWLYVWRQGFAPPKGWRIWSQPRRVCSSVRPWR